MLKSLGSLVAVVVDSLSIRDPENPATEMPFNPPLQ